MIQQCLSRRSELEAVGGERRNVKSGGQGFRFQVPGFRILDVGRRTSDLGRWHQAFAGLQARQFLLYLAGVQLGRGELAGRDVGVGQPGAPFLHDDGRQVVGPLFVQELWLDDGAGGDDARHRAGDQPLAGDLPDLLGDGDAVALVDEAGDVPLDGVVGDAGHRHPHPLGDRARGQDQVELAGGDLGVLVERLVKIAQPEKDDRVRVLGLDLEILFAYRGYFSHGCVAYFLLSASRLARRLLPPEHRLHQQDLDAKGPPSR